MQQLIIYFEKLYIDVSYKYHQAQLLAFQSISKDTAILLLIDRENE